MIRIILIVGILIFSGVVLYIEIDLFTHVEALISAFNQTPHCLEQNTSIDDEFGGGILDGSLPIRICVWINQLQDSSANIDLSPWAAWWDINKQYLFQFFYTVSLLLPIAILISILAYALASLAHIIDRWWGFGDFLVNGLDWFPYILWTLPFIGFAVALSAADLPGFLYLLVIFFGFGMFLVPFFARHNRRQLLTLQAIGMLDGERLVGYSELKILVRLFRYQFLSTIFIRHCIYCVLFIALMDYCFSSIINYRGIDQNRTVFNEASFLYQKADLHKQEARGHGPLALSQLVALQNFGVMDKDILLALNRFFDEPTFLLIPQARNDFRNAIKMRVSDPNNALSRNTEKKSKDPTPLDTKTALHDWLNLFSVTVDEQESIYLARLSSFYVSINSSIVFLLFFIMFIYFDLKRFLPK